MNDTDRVKRVIVIGGGITGLSAAHRLQELTGQEDRPLHVTLIDARHRLGGVIHTVKQDGFLIDTGPDNFVTAKPWALALARRLRLDSQIITTNEAYRSALVVRRGKLMPIPEGFLLMAPTKIWPIIKTPVFSMPGKLRMAMEWFLPPRKAAADESLASFVVRRFGREALDRVVQPLISGIYTARPEKLSLQATMPRFLELESKYGSVIRGMRAAGRQRKTKESGARYGMFITFKDGLQTLVHALQDRLGHVQFQLGRKALRVVKSDSQAPSSTWQVQMEDGGSMEADGVIIAGPSKHAAAVIADTDEQLARQLSSLQYASSAVVHLAYRREQIAHPLDAFGCVVPTIEKRHIIAASFSSVKYEGRAPEGSVLLRAFMGGALQPEMVARDDDALVALAQSDLEQLLRISGEPRFALVSRWPDSMAQYEVGHLERVAAVRDRITRHRGLELCGNGFEGVGIPDCVRAGEQAAQQLLAAIGPR